MVSRSAGSMADTAASPARLLAAYDDSSGWRATMLDMWTKRAVGAQRTIAAAMRLEPPSLTSKKARLLRALIRPAA